VGDYEIAKEIVIAMIQNDAIRPEEYPDAKTSAEVVGLVYQAILKSVKEA
jgi:hypothetical protein